VVPFLEIGWVPKVKSNNMRHGSHEDEEEIKAVILAMTDSFNKHDPRAGALLFTPDADFVNVLGMWRRGADEIERALRSRFETALANAIVRPVDVRIRFVNPDVAIAHVINEIDGMVSENGRNLPVHRELSIRVFVKENDKWLVTAFHNTTVRTPQTN
jgi:uncharacterized protein (TIGR02246 family)